ncbi:hypothetical protein [Ignicoccus hospitalis]|uniref:hypothetical protein n=1 Tax=Ignicoccus hospitalis TaxID=160233 RepID=UPI0011D13486|nr:hypothetical protein [Ignicoccus hospitalis]HIH89897.1 hypothetical protein [Desulfurococcaceae archaeon]
MHESCSLLNSKVALAYGEPFKKLYLLPSLLGCDEETVYLIPSHLAYLEYFVEKGLVTEVNNARELIIKLNEAMRRKMNVAVVEPEELQGIKNVRKMMAFVSWYLKEYTARSGRRAFILLRTSGFTERPPFFNYVEPWAGVVIEVIFKRGKVLMNVDYGGGVEVWTI